MRSRVLVVDDNPGYVRLVRLALAGDPDFEIVAEAASAENAVASAVGARPDVALVDVLLPAGQGFRLPASLRALVPGCAVVLTSAHPDGDLDAIRHLGGIAFLPKSLTPSRLGPELRCLLNALEQGQEALHQAAAQLPSSPESPRAARRFVEKVLGQWECDDLLDTVTLLVSELVGNVVLHAGSDSELVLRLMTDRLRVDVVDRSPLLPRRREAGATDQTGRGSDLVELLATAWGVTGRPDGKAVWFEITLPPAAAARSSR